MLSAVLLVLGQPSALAGDDDFGRTWARDKVLRPGCHEYRYQYKVKSPEAEWALETFLLDPDRKKVGSGQKLFNADPARGSDTFRLCRNATKPGTFKIRGKLTYHDGYDEHVVWIKPGFFRLRRAS
jgi:hypothetical protein